MSGFEMYDWSSRAGDTFAKILPAMIQIRCGAHHARCRITKWRLTDCQAWQLADETRGWNGLQSIFEAYSVIKAGNLTLFGARVSVQ